MIIFVASALKWQNKQINCIYINNNITLFYISSTSNNIHIPRTYGL